MKKIVRKINETQYEIETEKKEIEVVEMRFIKEKIAFHEKVLADLKETETLMKNAK